MIHNISNTVGATFLDRITGNANGNALSLTGSYALRFLLHVTTGAASGITVQFQAYDGTNSANLGTSIAYGASLTNQLYCYDILPADVTNALATATGVRAVYSSQSGTVTVDAIGEWLTVGAPPSFVNPPVYVGHPS